MNYYNVKIIANTLNEMKENIKSSFSLQKNFLKINSPPYLSSSAKKLIESNDDLKDIYNKFKKLNDLIIDYKNRNIDEFNLLIIENPQLKDLINVQRNLTYEIDCKIYHYNHLLGSNQILGGGFGKSLNYKINDFKEYFDSLHMNIVNKYKYKHNQEEEHYAFPRKEKIQKRHLNILYYDKNLNNEENSDLCA